MHKMSPSDKNSAAYNEKVDIDEDSYTEELMEEEVEYEEVEEEIEEIEEMAEDEEAVVVEEEATYVEKCSNTDDIEESVIEVDEKKKQADLLALPPYGSEVFVGGIPIDASEDELSGFCQHIGEVTEVRIIRGKGQSTNKGYGFVTFKTIELASKAIDELNNTDFKGKKLKFSKAQVKNKLFIGNIPKTWGDEDLKKVVTEIGPGVLSIKLLKDVNNPAINRGFAFIVYHNHACAEYCRQKMSVPKFKLDNNVPTVNWTDSKNDVSSPSSQVKTIYVRNLPMNITQGRFQKIFEHHGKITKVVLPPAKSGHEMSRFGFVHFAERSSAMKALETADTYEIDGHVLECSLAKPQGDQKSVKAPKSQKPGLLSSYPSHMGHGLSTASYGTLGAGYGASGFSQAMMYGRGAVMPMLLPDGRMGYVLQQPQLQQRPRNSMRSSSSNGGGRGRGRGRGRRYHPY